MVRYFSGRSIRQMERQLGREPVRRLHEFFRYYLVEDSVDGTIITVGKRHTGKRVWRH